jgi:hypothetical protein
MGTQTMLTSLMTELFGVGTHPETLTGNLQDLRWQKRLVVIFSDASGIKFDGQVRAFLEHPEALRDRDMAVFAVKGDDVRAVYGAEIGPTAETVRRQLDVPAGLFSVVLIGKDGKVKDRFDDVVDPAMLFAEVDAMPMRQAEMRG